MKTFSTSRRDAGSVLILVLVFITVIGAVTVALMSQAQTSLIASTLTRNQEKRVYAADAGIDWAIQLLRSDATLCPSKGSSATLPNPLTVNGRLVTVTCQTTDGSALGAGGWSIFLTSSAGTINTQSAANDTKTVSGPIFNRGGWSLQAALQVKNGDVYEYPKAGCAQPANLTFPNTTPGLYSYICTDTNVATPPSPQALPAAIPADASPYTNSAGNCRTFHPGRYTSAPVTGNGTNYFESGVYFFDNIGTWNLSDAIIGGQPAPILSKPGSFEPRISSTTPCGSDVAGAAGVEWILGGSSAISVSNQGHLELFSLPTNNVPGVGIFQVLATDPAPWAAKASTVGVGSAILSDGNGSSSELVVHGVVYTPTGHVTIRATNDTGEARLRSGVVAAQVDIWASASISSNLDISTGSGSGQRTILVTATATGAGEKPITASSVFTIGNDTNKTLTIASWRLVNA
jgi:hypothetical protein